MNKRENQYGARWYQVGDRELPSVTTILQIISKPALVAWSAKVERELVTSASADLYEDVAGTPRMSRAAYLVTLRRRVGLVKADRKSVVEGKSVDLGGRRIIKKKKREQSVVK